MLPIALFSTDPRPFMFHQWSDTPHVKGSYLDSQHLLALSQSISIYSCRRLSLYNRGYGRLTKIWAHICTIKSPNTDQRRSSALLNRRFTICAPKDQPKEPCTLHSAKVPAIIHVAR